MKTPLKANRTSVVPEKEVPPFDNEVACPPTGYQTKPVTSTFRSPQKFKSFTHVITMLNKVEKLEAKKSLVLENISLPHQH
jgi:hypothetical protein